MEYDDVPGLVGKLSRLISVTVLRLKKMNSAHLDSTYQWLQEKDLRLSIDCLKSPTREENQAYWKNNWDDNKRMDFAIIDYDGNHIGNCGLNNIDKARKKAELWIYLGTSKRKGYGKLAVVQLLNKAFRELSLNRVYLRALKNNHAAISLYKNMGFQDEGTIRCDTFQDNTFVDAVLMSILHDDFVPREQ